MKNCVIWALVLALLLPLAPAAFATEAAEAEPSEIFTPDDLLAMAENPEGSFILMEDLDMTGVEWIPLDFSGSFHGNGHAILNLTITQPGETTAPSYDGNLKEYETWFAGLFGILRNAQVKNLKLINVRALLDVDVPCYVGAVAGYCDASTISSCTVTGSLELRAFKDAFGVGGVTGYGVGKVEDCDVDVTLITVDTDAATKDEQFLGGIYANGFIDVLNTEVHLEGFISEHGYVHSGGVVGMYAQAPLGRKIYGYLTGNQVSGQITFFEDNDNRRAYCEPLAGEVLASRFTVSGNKTSFKRNEIRDDFTELRPCMCAAPVYAETVIAPGCDSFGYTSYTCESCGYSYTDHYTLYQHTVTAWTVTQEPTLEAEGISVGYCDNCGKEFRRLEPKLEPVPTQAPTEAPTEAAQPTESTPVEAPAQPKETWQIPAILAGGTGVLIVLVLLLMVRNKKKYKPKHLKKKNTAR